MTLSFLNDPKFSSPLQKVTYNNRTIYVKRDDLIDPFVSGNKWRKLKYILQDAKNQHKKHLVTFGGAYSNHVVATAAAGAKFGFNSTAFIRGEEVSNGVLAIAKLFGMELIFVSREAYKQKKALFQSYFGSDVKAYFIDEGGANAAALEGCAELIAELPPEIDHIFCAAGTGTTAAGLALGIEKENLNTQLNIVPVLKGGDFLRGEIIALNSPVNRLTLHTDFHFGGYAKTNAELIDFIQDFVASTGLLIEPVYTGKLFFAIFKLFDSGYLKEQDTIVAIHTGGLSGLFGMADKFN